MNTAIGECTIDDLGIVVLDELHMIDDVSRGYQMELMASKLLSLERSVQIVGMSATLAVRFNGTFPQIQLIGTELGDIGQLAKRQIL